ncbi:MAG: hypothetical protein ACLF0G_14105 [Candidatus Brocadiia bacterium]
MAATSARGLLPVVLLQAAAALLAAEAGEELESRLARQLRRMRAELDESFIVEREGVFLVAGNLSRRDFEAFRRHTILASAQALWRGYFEKKPDYPIRIYLFRDAESYRHWAKELFGDTGVSHFGYYKPDRQALVMNIGTGGGTLVHELTHALMTPDFPRAPTWFDEALASLHEQCRIRHDTIEGLVNWRLPALQRAVREDRLVPLAELVATTTAQFRGEREALHYAEARYLALYLQKQGLLRRFYREFRAAVGDDPTGARTLAAVTGKPLAELQREWVAWVATLRWRR